MCTHLFLFCLCIKKQTWNPIDNKKFETLSYLPPLSDDSIAKEIDYMMKKGWVPCLEFDAVRSNKKFIAAYIYRYASLTIIFICLFVFCFISLEINKEMLRAQ